MFKKKHYTIYPALTGLGILPLPYLKFLVALGLDPPPIRRQVFASGTLIQLPEIAS